MKLAENMEIDKIAENGTVTYKLKGRLDTQSSPEFQKILDEGFKNGEINLIFDCKDLKYMSSAGLRIILHAKKQTDAEEEMPAQKGSLKLINVCDEILEVFEMTGFSEMLSIE